MTARQERLSSRRGPRQELLEERRGMHASSEASTNEHMSYVPRMK